MHLLTRADEILLVSIACLGDEAFSTRIIQEVALRTAKKITVGSLWVSLDQLADRGYLRKQKSHRKKNSGKTPGHGGRPRVYYQLTPRGVRALNRVRAFQDTLWADVPDVIVGTGS